MCKTARECILSWAKGFWPDFDRMPYHFDHFYKIAEREGIQVVIDSEHSLDIKIDDLPFTNDNRIMINASGHIPEGDSLVCTYARLFNYYYLNKDASKTSISALTRKAGSTRSSAWQQDFSPLLPVGWSLRICEMVSTHVGSISSALNSPVGGYR